VPSYIDEIGKCAAFENVTVMPLVGGQVTEIKFTDGQDLKKGQPLFTIDPRPYKALWDESEATLKKDQATAENAKAFADRQLKVFKQNSISAQDYDQARFASDAAAAAVVADMAARDAAKLNWQYCFITSPIDGRAGQHQIDPGNVVKANEGSMLVIQRMDPIYADFIISEGQLGAVRANMARGTLKTLVSIPSDTREPREGNLTFLDSAVDGSGTVKLRATLKNADRHYWPGQFVNIRLVLNIKKNAVLVPNVATQISQKGPYVYVIKPDQTAELRPVQLGQRQGDMVVVEQGLKAGETVVIDGQMSIIPKFKVRVIAPEKPQDAAMPVQANSQDDSEADQGGKS
jgi:multidrug efflux system membrane fusion protein